MLMLTVETDSLLFKDSYGYAISSGPNIASERYKIESFLPNLPK